MDMTTPHMTAPLTHDDPLILYGEVFQSRLMLGTCLLYTSDAADE